MREQIKWHVEKRKVSDLKPHAKNPRVITEDGINKLSESIDEIGFAQPININLDNTILSGHARYQYLLKENPNQEVDVYVPNRMLTNKEVDAVIVRMNKTIAGKWNFDILANEFELEDLIDWGFAEFELDLAKDVVDIVNKGDETAEWADCGDSAEFIQGDEYITVSLHFRTRGDRKDFIERSGLIPKKAGEKAPWVVYMYEDEN